MCELRAGVDGEHDRDGDGGDEIGNDQDAILHDLGPSDAFHPAEHVEESGHDHAGEAPTEMSAPGKRERTTPTPRLWPATQASETKVAQVAAPPRAVLLS